MKQAGLAPSSAQRGAIVRDTPISRTETPGAMSMLRIAELVKMLSDRASLNKREAKEIVRAFFEVMLDTLESGDDVQLSGFGKFQLREKSQRPGRNPKTGETTCIAARRVVTFHASQKLKARLETDGEQRRRARP